MAKREILAGSTDQTIDVLIMDSSSTVGAGLTGLAYNTAGLTCYYRKGATGTPTALTLATQTVGGAHSDGGFVAVDGTNCPGQYRLDLSDTIVATAGMVTLYLRGAANMAPCTVEIEVVSVNKFDSVRMGLTALPNAAAEAAGGLYTRGTGAGQIAQSNNGQIDTDVKRLGGTTQTGADVGGIVSSGTHGNAALYTILTSTGVKLAAAAVQSIWDALTSALTTANSVGKLLVDNINATISSRASQASLDTLDDYVDTEITTILTAVGTTLDDYVDDLETRITAALATALQAHALGIGRVVVGVGSTTSAVVFDTVNGAAPSATNDFYKDRHLVFTSGALALQACSITGYTGGTTTAAVSTLTGAPVATVTAIIV